MHDLFERVNAGVGAAGAVNDHGMIGDPRQRGFQRSLHARHAGLCLPAVKVGAVVLDAQRDAARSQEVLDWFNRVAPAWHALRCAVRRGPRR